MEGGMISVDRWSKGSSAYFLTHLHSDHTRGLSSSWSNGPLYCSRTTAKLFPLKFPDFDLSLLRAVDIGSWLKLPFSSSTSSSVHVMPIPALHCPGAVMFLFRGEFGHVLYTGDFRWEINGDKSDAARTMLLNALDGQLLDVLYLDNTYCNPAYCFPTRDVAAQQVIDIITSHPDHDIIIGIDSLGKEDLLLSIADSLNIKIWVWPERLQTMHLLGLPDIFTTRTCLTRVRAVPRYSFSINTLEALNTRKPTIGIMPSGLPWLIKPFAGQKQSSASSCLSVDSTCGTKPPRDGTRLDLNMKSVERVHQYVYSVPYSEHSCFPEIKHFYGLLQPAHVKGIVTVSSWYVDPVYYLGHLLKRNLANQMNSLNLETNGEVEQKLKMKNKNFKGTGKKYRSSDKFTSGVQIHRVNLQQKTRGIKITEYDDSDFPSAKT